MITVKWVFTWTSNELGKVVRAKARLVARGFRQVEGVDYFETFASTLASSCVRLLASIAYELDLDSCNIDAEQMFVQSDLGRECFYAFVRMGGRQLIALV